MKQFIFLISICIILISCYKQKEPIYTEETLFIETFDDPSEWIPTPEQPTYTPGSNCYDIENGLLKLTFDHALSDCGCGWVGAKKSSIAIKEPNKKNLGVRIKLSQGLFQYVLLGIPSSSGNAYSQQIESSFEIQYQVFNLRIPSWDYGKVPEGNTVNPWLNRYPGKSFEVIHENNNKVTFLVDGAEISSKYVQCSFHDGVSNELEIEFKLGHQPEFSPRTDYLWIENIEVYTWEGPRP